MYFLAYGNCEVLVKDHLKKEIFVRDIYPGMMFGEVALLYKTKRTASVRSKDRCTVGAVDSETFEEMCNQFPQIELRLKQEAIDYRDHWKRQQLKNL
jgi:CRP-like cAMP-binding protein